MLWIYDNKFIFYPQKKKMVWDVVAAVTKGSASKEKWDWKFILYYQKGTSTENQYNPELP